jgi:hypothetical protein
MSRKLAGKRSGFGKGVPLDAVAAIVEGGVGKIERTENSLSFQSSLGETVVSITPRNVKTTGGAVLSNVITVKTALAEKISFFGTPMISSINRMAMLSAVMKDENSGQVMVASRVSVYGRE